MLEARAVGCVIALLVLRCTGEPAARIKAFPSQQARIIAGLSPRKSLAAFLSP